MSTRIFGIETEYALVAAEPAGAGLSEDLCRSVLRQAEHDLVHLPAGSSGMFLSNGARFYLDAGNHLEYSTPECSTPDKLVNHVRAGDAILQGLVDRVGGGVLLRSNIDYLAPCTWGSHESYRHRCRDTERLATDVLPHLISRQIFCGAGGLDPFKEGLEFAIAPRVFFFRAGRSYSRLALHSTRDEPLSGPGDHRLHVILGETLCSDIALWLRVATTCIVVALAEEDLLEDKESVQLDDPVNACHSYACDPSLLTACKAMDGSMVTALDIQRHYLAQARMHAGHPALPEWADEACDRWEKMLNLLSHGPGAVSTICDWAIKLAVFADHVAATGFGLSEPCPRGAGVHEEDTGRLPLCERSVSRLETVRSIRSRRRDTAGLDEFFAAADAGDPRVSALRRELCVLDSRFTETPNGLFALLEGTLNCRIEGVNPDTIKAAETTPPPGTRAKARGDLVAQLHGNGTRYQAGWCSIRDRKERLTYQFESPISLSGVWVKKINLNSNYHWVGLAYNSGDFATVRKLVDEAYEYLEAQGNLASASRFLIYRAWVEARSGDVDKAVETLREAHRNRTVSDSIVDHVAVYRWRGLTPEHTPIWRWIARREKLGSQNFDQLSNVAFQGYRGHALMKARRFEEAEASLRASIETDFERPNHVRLQSICRCDLANCLRLRGATDKAGGLLKQAHDHLSENRYLWELNDAWLPNALKLYGVDSMPQTRLKDARRSLRRMGNLIGVARLMLLEARGSAGRGIRPRSIVPVHHLRDRVHDLRDCPLLAKILDHWEPWIEGEPLMQDPDYYWGL